MRELNQIKRMLFGGTPRLNWVEAWYLAGISAFYAEMGYMCLASSALFRGNHVNWSELAVVALFLAVVTRCWVWIDYHAASRIEVATGLQDKIERERLIAYSGDSKGPGVLRSWSGIEWWNHAATHVSTRDYYSRMEADLDIGPMTSTAIVCRAYVEVFAEHGLPLTMTEISNGSYCNVEEQAEERAEQYMHEYVRWRNKRGKFMLLPDCCFFDTGNQSAAVLAACLLLGCASVALFIVASPSVRLHSYLLVHALAALSAGYAAVVLLRMRLDRVGRTIGLTLSCIGVLFIGGGMPREWWQVADIVTALWFMVLLIYLVTLLAQGSRRSVRYGGLEADHAIKDALYDGTVVRLDDGSIWQLEAGHYPLGSGEDECLIVVAEAPPSRGPSTHVLINIDANKTAYGRLISQ